MQNTGNYGYPTALREIDARPEEEWTACIPCEAAFVFDAYGEERQRLAALDRTGLLDTPQEEAFDRIVRLAARLLGAPVALLSLVNEHRQFFKSAVGLTGAHASLRETPRSISFSQHVVTRREPFVIQDARTDALMRNSPIVRGMGVIAYLGVPVMAEGSQVIGSLCVNDFKPRAWTPEEIRTLQDLAEAVMTEIALRAGSRGQESLLAEVKTQHKRLNDLVATVPGAVWEAWGAPASSLQRYAFISDYLEKMLGYSTETWLAKPNFWIAILHPNEREYFIREAEAIFAGGKGGTMRFRWAHKEGHYLWIEAIIFVVCDETGTSQGMRGVCLDITSRKEAEADLEITERKLRDASRQAGMAEVATGVLHNVGNVLNSVNVSAVVVTDHIRQSSVSHLDKAVALLRQNEGNNTFLTSDGNGRKLADFLAQLSTQVQAEHATALDELKQLGKNIDHIKEIVSMQQQYARVAGISEEVSVAELVDDSLRMNAGALLRHDVQIVREFKATPVINVDKHKVMQILVNLIRNAKYACDEANLTGKCLTVSVEDDVDTVRISVRDNGVGIPPENLRRIFSHGFTTRKDGHGFGLHSGALAAKEMGGSLSVQSEGAGRGATFTLELPRRSPQSSHDS
jgi:PAS domain S-box-containing protein